MGQEPISVFFDMLTDDVEWVLFGSHVFAGTHRGKSEIEERLIAPMLKVLVGSKFQIQNMIAEGDEVVVEGVGHAPTKDGREYNNTYCLVVTVRDGKISQIREYLDTELVTEFFGMPQLRRTPPC